MIPEPADDYTPTLSQVGIAFVLFAAAAVAGIRWWLR